MKKTLLSIALLCFAFLTGYGAEVSVAMNAVSKTMTLQKKGTAGMVEVGNPVNNKYTFNAAPGEYILSAYDGETLNGTIELTVDDEQPHSFQFYTITAWAVNAGWIPGVDYTIDASVSSREGAVRNITPGSSAAAGRITFVTYPGDTYRAAFIPSAARQAEGYLRAATSAAVTSNSNTSKNIPVGYPCTVTAPAEAAVFVGFPDYAGYYFRPFTEITPTHTADKGGNKVYTYMIAGSQRCIYRVSQPGKITYAGIFTKTSSPEAFTITKAMLEGSPKKVDYNTAGNHGYNVSDVYLNINEKGHLKLSSGQTHQIVNIRAWQTNNDIVSNLFIEPDYHYTVINEEGTEDAGVVTVNEKGLLTAVGSGTAIVLVTYDAINAASAAGGPFFSALWPENTGVFVVSVDGAESGIKPNMTINESLNNEDTDKIAGIYVDAELDVFYYPEKDGGYDYTFKPAGAVSSVTLAQPLVGAEMTTYTGFAADNVKQNEDGSYTVRLIHGRNIVKISSTAGSEYQVLTAKSVNYTITNASREGGRIEAGDEIAVRFSTIYHPSTKLAGIYNMSACLQYNAGGTIVNGAGSQYTFASTAGCQTIKTTIPADWNTENEFLLTEGVIKDGGKTGYTFGDPFGSHRLITLERGRNPNFTAANRLAYLGALPDISIKVNPVSYYTVAFAGLPENAQLTVKDRKGSILAPNEGGGFVVTGGTYSFEVQCAGYRVYRDEFSLSTANAEKEIITVAMVPALAADWDGNALSEPEKVTADEASIAGGAFEGMEGYYKLASGAQLAWFANAVNTGSSTICAVMTNDIHLAGYPWTPIGNNAAACQYKGIFNGAGYAVKGLYIHTSKTCQALFGYINGAAIKNLEIEGCVLSTANYAAGLAAYSTGNSTIQNCINKAVVSGKQYAAGILGYSTNHSLKIENCCNMADLTSTGTYIGGILGGIMNGSAAVINNAANHGDITAGGNYAGGIAGNSAAAQITNAANTGSIVSNGSNYAGGISGSMSAAGLIRNAFHAGSISLSSFSNKPGAIKGNSNGKLENTYASAGNYSDAPAVKAASEFASGEVSWLLGNAFGQEIGTDAYPALGGRAVYQISNNLDNVKHYTNGSLSALRREGYRHTLFALPAGTEIKNESAAETDVYVLYITTGYSEAENSTIVLNLTRPVHPEKFDLTHKGYWKDTYNYEDYLTIDFNDGDASRRMSFTHNVGNYAVDGMWGDDFYDGFTYSINADSAKQTSWISNQWGCMAGGGIKTDEAGNVLKDENGMVLVDKGIPYLTAFGDVMNSDEYYFSTLGMGVLQTVLYKTYTAVGVYINNHPWPYYGNIAGDGMAKGLNEDGDYFKLVIEGLNSDYERTGKKVEHILAQYKENEGLIQSRNWEWVDLSSLGDVSGFYYTLQSTDMTNGYMNTAAYFCLDKLTVKVPDTGTGTDSNEKAINFSVYPNPFAEYIIVSTASDSSIAVYDLAGRIMLLQVAAAGKNLIDTSALPHGSYVLKCGNETIKIIK